LFLFSGQIEYNNACDLVDIVCKKEKPKPTALLYIATPGGDPHAAYRIIRALRSKYKTVRLAIAGPCKSAGTLIAIGAHSLSMAETGELGPLDIQLSKPDEIIPNSSGLDIFQALAVTTRQAFEAFEHALIDLIAHSSGSISTKTAAELAGDLAVGLFSPVMAQIDPTRLGEVQRAIKIAQAYGEKLGTPNLKPNSLERLVEQYPSHGFVIDFDEAKQLFRNVDRLEGTEHEIYDIFRPLLRHSTGVQRSMDLGATFQRRVEPETKNARPSRNRRGRPNLSAGNAASQTDISHSRPAELDGARSANPVATPARSRRVTRNGSDGRAS
jgi:hypothetical protein